MLKSLIKKIDNYDVISFDIFDTLINRMVSNSTDVFYLIAKKYNENNEHKLDINDFCRDRINSEKELRKKMYREITLEEIYQNMPNTYKRELLMQYEVDAELDVCYANEEMVNILNECKIRNKKVIIVSDMYLDKGIIANILDKNNIHYDELFVSSEYGVSKSNNGLFKIVKSKYNNNKILHIGDNFKSDYISPMLMGINAFNYSVKKNDKKISKKQEFLNRFAAFHSNNFDEYVNFGYKYLGPLMYGFSEFLINKIDKKKDNKIIFFAREGKFIKACFDLYCDNSKDTHYMYISRKSATKYCSSKFSSFDELKSNISISKNEDVETFLKRMSLYNNKIIELLLKNDIKLYNSFYEKKVQQFFELNFDLVFKFSDSIFDEYLNEVGFKENCSIVDIGWSGSMQDLLMKYLNYNISGYYFGVRNKRMNEYKNGYIYDGLDTNLEMKSRNFNGLIEIIMSADHGTTVDYLKKDGRIIPKLKDNEVPEDIMRLILKIQEGAKQFLKDFKKVNYKYDLDSHEYYNNFLNIGLKPSKKIIELFSNFVVYDEKRYKLIEDKGLIYYIMHPKTFIYDYKESGWKSAFMKKNFGFYFNSLYYLLYKIDKKRGK